jgi:hypothetical protein
MSRADALHQQAIKHAGEKHSQNLEHAKQLAAVKAKAKPKKAA